MEFIKFSLSARNRIRRFDMLAAFQTAIDLQENRHNGDTNRRIDRIHHGLEGKLDEKRLLCHTFP